MSASSCLPTGMAMGRPLDKDGKVQVQATSWGSMLDGRQSDVTVRRGVAW